MIRKLLLLAAGLCAASLFGAAITKVGGSGTTKVGGSGTTKVNAFVAATPTPDIFHARFSDGSGTTVTSVVGPNGTLYGADAATSWTTGKSGSGYSIYTEGGGSTRTGMITNSAVTFGSPAVITLCMWVNLTATNGMFAESSADSPSTPRSFHLLGDAGDLVALAVDASGNFQQDKTPMPATGSWIHVAVVFDYTGGGSIKIYYDSVLQSLTNVASTFSGTTSHADLTLNIGARAAANYITTSKFDEVKLFGRELTSAEITAVAADAP